MSMLTVAEARKFGLTGEDEALQLAIDDIEDEIVSKFGPYAPSAVSEILYPAYRSPTLITRRRIASVTSILERMTSNVLGGVTQTLDATDWRLVGPFILERLATGTHPLAFWSSHGIEIVYVPVDDTARRKMATVDVLKSELAYSGFASRTIGDYSESAGGVGADDLQSTRTKILRRLRPKGMVIA